MSILMLSCVCLELTHPTPISCEVGMGCVWGKVWGTGSGRAIHFYVAYSRNPLDFAAGIIMAVLLSLPHGLRTQSNT